MTETKACFGQCANMSIRYRNQTKKHYLYVDQEKSPECDECPLFTQCMFLRNNEILRDLIQLIDAAGAHDPRPKIG